MNQIRSGHLSRSHSHYKEFLDLRGDGRVVLYKRADHQNPKWTVRLKIPSSPGFVVKSAKTTNDHEARRFAEDLYYQLEGRARRGEPINSPTFARVFDAWSRSLIGQNQRTKIYVNGNVRRIELWALPYFRDDRIDQVTENQLGDYIEWRLSQPRRPAVASLKNERTALRQLFAFAKRKGYINEIPELRIKSSKPNARPDIPDAEWKRLCDYLPVFVDKAQDKRRRRERYYLVLYILILANTGIRIGEARRLQWRDISSTKTLTGETRAVLSHDSGFKLTYAVCRPVGKDAKGQNTCRDDDSHDWSDSRTAPYRWFSDINACQDASIRLNTEHRADVKVNPDDAFTAYCVPASKVSGRTPKGYKMEFALTPPDAVSDDNIYAELRDRGSQTASVFKTFNTCYDAVDAAYSKAMKDLGADENGSLLSDKTKSVELTATCVRVY